MQTNNHTVSTTTRADFPRGTIALEAHSPMNNSEITATLQAAHDAYITSDMEGRTHGAARIQYYATLKQANALRVAKGMDMLRVKSASLKADKIAERDTKAAADHRTKADKAFEADNRTILPETAQEAATRLDVADLEREQLSYAAMQKLVGLFSL